MKWQSSIRTKLVVIISLVTLFTLALGLIAVGVNFYQTSKETLITEAESQAKVLAFNSSAILAFGQPEDGVNVLETSSITSQYSAAIFDVTGNRFAMFDNGGGFIAESAFESSESTVWEGDWLHIHRIIRDVDEEMIGAVYLRISTVPFQQQMQKMTITFLVVIGILVVLSYLLARRMQRYISGPIEGLADISHEVSQSQNYSLRVPVYSDDEIGNLSRTFNQMLETIEQRQQERDMAEEALQLNKRRLERAVKDLQYLANYDSLTQLPNRALCMDRIKYALKRASRTQTLVGILFLDLDHFKDVNDSLGHAVGDELLRAASKRLLDLLREEDTLARLGGDEFVIILNSIKDTESVITVVEKIVESFSEHFELSDYIVNSTVSIGICLYPEDGQDVDALMKAADAAMYRAKEVGRNTYEFYQSDMNEMALRRHQIANELRKAVQRNELHLVYQPQLNSADDQIVGAEALLRWQHPTLGFVSPAEFIPIAENTGLIIEIGMWVLESACRQIKAWREQGCNNLRVAVNLSAIQFRQSDLPLTISTLLSKYQLPPDCLELEITESMLMRDITSAIKTLSKLKKMQIRIAIDDFGTGYSSLSYLRRLPLDSLKVDRSFIDEVGEDPDDTSITLAIISMAKSLRLEVVAEGVEKAEQKEFLRQYNCDVLQGYYISKPLPPDEFLRFYNEFGNQSLTNRLTAG